MRGRSYRGATIAFIAAVACVTAPVGFRYQPASGFQPHVERIQQANRDVFVVMEGLGTTATGEALYYIAYVTNESIPVDFDAFGPGRRWGDPLWGEIQALWSQRRPTLDPKTIQYVVIDARSSTQSTGFQTRRSVFQSDGASWHRDPRAQFEVEH